MGCSESSSQREIYNCQHPLQKEKRFQINNLNFYPGRLGIKEQAQFKDRTRKEIINIREETHEIQNRKKR